MGTIERLKLNVKQILVYSDSLTWGIVPGTRDRLPFEQRWPGVMEDALNASERKVRVIENCLNGRRTVWNDPFKPGRNGREALAQCIEMNSPLSLVILMLGTNDFQCCHPHNDAWAASQGILALVHEVRQAPIEPGMPVPPILVVCPPATQIPKGAIAPKFRGAQTRSAGLVDAYSVVCSENACSFFDAGTVTSTSVVDGVHLDCDQHRTLGLALAPVVEGMM
jgi:lysophospholipase L1-like esterase